MNKPLSLTIAIPAYNEAASLPDVLKDSYEIAPKYAKDFEILVVNDGSTDGTEKVIATFLRDHPKTTVVTHKTNQGFSGAIKSCYRKASKDIIFLLPADGQIDVSDIQKFWEVLPESDVVVGYRTHNPEPFTRKLNSFVFHTLYRTLFGVKLHEISTSILWRKKVLDSLDITAIPRSALIEPEVVYKAWSAGWRFAQVPIPYYPRTGGTPKGANPLMVLITLKELIKLWWKMRIYGAL